MLAFQSRPDPPFGEETFNEPFESNALNTSCCDRQGKREHARADAVRGDRFVGEPHPEISVPQLLDLAEVLAI